MCDSVPYICCSFQRNKGVTFGAFLDDIKIENRVLYDAWV